MSVPSERTPKQRIATVAVGAAWLIGLSAALTLADGFLGNVPIARAVLGGLFVTIAMGRAGVLWDDDDPDGETYKIPALLSLGGAARAASIGLVPIAIAAAAGWAAIGPGSPAPSLLVGVVVAVGLAVRDELLLRALPLHFARRAGLAGDGHGAQRSSVATPSELAVLGFTSLLSVAPLALSAQATPAALAMAASIGFLHGAMQLRTRSAWGPIASAVVLRLVLGPTLQTGLLRIEWRVGELTLGSLASGHAVWIFTALAVLVGVLGLPRRPLPPPDPLSDASVSQERARRRPPRTRRPRPEAPPPSASGSREPEQEQEQEPRP